MLDLMTLTSNQLSKASLAEWEAFYIDLINEGEINPLEAHAKAKAIISALTNVIKATESLAHDEAAKYGGKSFSAFGASITIKDGAVTPNYRDDMIWSDLKNELDAREELLKLAFKSKDVQITDTTTGEVVPKVSPKYAKSSISIQFK